MLVKSCLTAALAASLGLLLTPSAQADLLVNGGFEDMPNWNNGIGGDGSYTLLVGNSIPGWTIEPGHGATIHITGGAFNYPTISGLYSLNTDGEGFNGHNVNIYQDFAATAGVQYVLTFDWINWATSSVPGLDVSITDTVTNTVLTSGNYGLSAGLHNESLAFLGTGNALRLRIQHVPESGFNDNTFIVDNFTVNAVPAPGAAAALAFAALAAGHRRRR